MFPLVLAATATQASIVVLAPLLVAISGGLGASVSAVGAARSVLAGTAFVGALAIGPLIDRLGPRPLIVRGGALALTGAAASAAAPSLVFFYAAHVLTGLGVACLLSAGFAGVASYFEGGEMAWAMGYVVGFQSFAWIVGNPIVGALADAGSWRLSYAVPATICLGAAMAALTLPLARRHAPAGAGGDGEAPPTPEPVSEGLRAVARDRSARLWTLAELVAYASWSAELTYAGAFYIRTYDVNVATVGLLLAVGSAAFLVASLNTARLTARFPRKPLLVASAFGMGGGIALILNWTPSVAATLAMFCVMATFAGVRLAGSSSLGLDQLPGRPGAMMGARTASTQLGYMIGAAWGGGVLALWGFGELGLVLFTGMGASGLLLLGVRDPTAEPHLTPEPLAPEPLPDPIAD